MRANAEVIKEIQGKSTVGKILGYAKLSGPGWLQGAITLGGGSLAGALYLGVVAGFGLMWLQPLAMICGIIMLSAIAYVTLTTEKRPFGLINRNLSPVLGWAWLIATIMANIVWCMPQFNLSRAALQQNLIPMIGNSHQSTLLICIVIFAIAFYVNVLYQSEGKGVRIFDNLIKIIVGIIVLSFFAVVFTLTTSNAIEWSKILKGFIPNLSLLFKPAAGYSELISQSSAPEWWQSKISSDQRNVIIAAFASAVGINMTWLLPYSLLKKGWGRIHRELSIFDLSIGLFVPFFLATSCVVIASASQFHTKTADVPAGAGAKTINQLVESQGVIANAADQELALMLVKRDNFQLANALEPLAGNVVSQTIFGIGVLGMALSTIIILMLMNGLAFQELLKRPNDKKAYFIGCAVSGLAGLAGPFIWTGGAAAALAIPTSVIGGTLIPIAYLTFFLIMNSRKILGDDRPTGKARITWNLLMGFATSVATFASAWALTGKFQANSDNWKGIFPILGLIGLVVLFVIGITSFLKNEKSVPAQK